MESQIAGRLFGKLGSSNHVWWYTEIPYSCAEYTSLFGLFSRTGKAPALLRLPPHQPHGSSGMLSHTFGSAPLGQLTPSTMTSRSGLAASTALPPRSAASRQSWAVSPQPQHAPVPFGAVPAECGSLCRSMPTTVGLPLYRLASICMSAIHVLSGTASVYQSAVCPALVGRCRSRKMRMPLLPAYATTLSRICSGDRPTRSGLVFVLMLVACAPGFNASSEYGTRIVLYPSCAMWSIMERHVTPAHRPWNVLLSVSMPNQLSPVSRTVAPVESTICEPRVLR